MKENIKEEYLKIVEDQRTKARHWRFCHYDAASKFQNYDKILGGGSVGLSTIILGFAAYSLSDNIPFWVKMSLTSLTIIQGLLLVMQLYTRPNSRANSHTNSAARLGELSRGWIVLGTKINTGEDVTIGEIAEIMKKQDSISKESEPIPRSIIKKNGKRPAKKASRLEGLEKLLKDNLITQSEFDALTSSVDKNNITN